MRKWEELPKFMRTDEVKKYYDILIKHEKELKLKRFFDILLSMILLVILSPIMWLSVLQSSWIHLVRLFISRCV